MDRSLLIGLVHRTKSILDSIEDLSLRSREKFIDKESGEFFYRGLRGDIDKIDLLMTCFLNYIKSTTPIIKKDTVNTFIDAVLGKNRAALEEKKIRIMRRSEKELPETIAPDEQMTFILDTVLQYAMASTPSGGLIEFITKSFVPPKTTGEEWARDIEIMVTFTHYQRPGEQLMKEPGSPFPQKGDGLDLLLQLVYVIVQKNQGTMEYEPGENKGKSSIVLRLPADRRKAVRYQPVYE
jgi:hypothetical protein